MPFLKGGEEKVDLAHQNRTVCGDGRERLATLGGGLVCGDGLESALRGDHGIEERGPDRSEPRGAGGECSSGGEGGV